VNAAPKVAPERNPEPTTTAPFVPAARHRFALAAGIGGAVSGSEFAPGALLGASWDPGPRGFGVRLSAAWSGARSQALQGQEVLWTRWPLLAGPFVRFSPGRFGIDVEGGAALGWLRLHGNGFSSDASRGAASVGSYAALRFTPANTSWHPFVMAAPILWFGHATAKADRADGSSTTDLPSFEVLFAAGAQVERARGTH